MSDAKLQNDKDDKYSLRGRVFNHIREGILSGRYVENEELKEKLETKINTVHDLFIEVQELNKENKQLKVNAPVQVVHKHNERNAGRKVKFSDEIINYVVDMKNIGWSYVDIKQKVWQQFGKSISVGSISNIIKNNS